MRQVNLLRVHLVRFFIEDAGLVTGLNDLPHYGRCKFRMSLYRDKTFWRVHALNGTDWRGAETFDTFRIREYDIAVHLMYLLSLVSGEQQFSGSETHKLLKPENFLSFGR